MKRSECVWTLVLLMFGIVFLFAPGTASPAAQAQKHGQSAGGSKGSIEAYDFALKDTEGILHRLSSNKGKRAVMLYFWSTWCPYCRKAESKVSAIREKYSPDDLQIFAINTGESLEKIKRYQEARKLTYIVLQDEQEAVAEKYGLQGVPCFILISKEGKLVYREYTLPEEADIKSELGISPGMVSVGAMGQKEGRQAITSLSDDELEQLLDKADISYERLSESIYLLPDKGIAIANRGRSLEAAYFLLSKRATPFRIEEWNNGEGNESAKADATGIIASIHSELQLTGAVTEAKIIAFMECAARSSERFHAFFEQKPEADTD